MHIMCDMATPTIEEQDALKLRAQNLLPDDEDMAAFTQCFSPQQADIASKMDTSVVRAVDVMPRFKPW